MPPITEEQCKKDELLAEAVRTGGIEEVLILLEQDNTCTASVVIKLTGARLYLSTRRHPNEPRRFKRVESAISTLHQITGAKRFIVVMR